MSRIGRLPIALPDGVNVKIDGNTVTTTGKLGTLSVTVDPVISVKVEGKEIIVTRANDARESKAKHGLYRMLINNNVIGVSQGYKKSLLPVGVGYKANLQGKDLVLNIGYSHPITIKAPEGITFEVITQPALEVVVKGIDKEAVGQCAANIHALRKVDPYHGYGIHYKDKPIPHKEIKKAAK